jgi:hypothetical protein
MTTFVNLETFFCNTALNRYEFSSFRTLSFFELSQEVTMKNRSKTNRLKAAMKRKNVKSSLRKSKGERKYPS